MSKRLVIAAPSAQTLGGVQTWLDLTAPALADLGWNVSVLLTKGPHSDVNRYLGRHRLPGVMAVEAPTGSREGRVRALHEAIGKVSPDIVLAVNLADVGDAVGRLKGDGRKMRLATALHGLESAHFAALRRQAAVLDAVICTSRLGAKAAVAWAGMPGSRVFHAAAGIPVGPVAPDAPPSDCIELVYAGRLDHPEKRVLDLPGILKALDARSVPFHLRIAGSGPDEAALRKALEPFSRHVVYEGVLDIAALKEKVYHPGRILVLLSPRETGPLVAWEAMERSMAVVTSDFLGRKSEGALRHDVNCLVYDVGDFAGAAAAIESLRNARKAATLASAGRHLVEQRYSVDSCTAAWDRALTAVLDLPVRTPEMSPIPPSGRLDRILGISLAETVRGTLRRRFVHQSAGAEWPHSYDGTPELDGFLHQLDREEIPYGP